MSKYQLVARRWANISSTATRPGNTPSADRDGVPLDIPAFGKVMPHGAKRWHETGQTGRRLTLTLSSFSRRMMGTQWKMPGVRPRVSTMLGGPVRWPERRIGGGTHRRLDKCTIRAVKGLDVPLVFRLQTSITIDPMRGIRKSDAGKRFPSCYIHANRTGIHEQKKTRPRLASGREQRVTHPAGWR